MRFTSVRLLERYTDILKDMIPGKKKKNVGSRMVLVDFKLPDSISGFATVTDASTGGGSYCSLETSEAGNVLFRGHTNSSVPVGTKLDSFGFATMVSSESTRMYKNSLMQLTEFQGFEISLRGDGRCYNFFLKDPDSDMHQAQFWTRGGPYWEKIQIPIRSFILTRMGLVTEYLEPPLVFCSFGITIHDTRHGPFSLEIEYIHLIKSLRQISYPYLIPADYPGSKR